MLRTGDARSQSTAGPLSSICRVRGDALSSLIRPYRSLARRSGQAVALEAQER